MIVVDRVTGSFAWSGTAAILFCGVVWTCGPREGGFHSIMLIMGAWWKAAGVWQWGVPPSPFYLEPARVQSAYYSHTFRVLGGPKTMPGPLMVVCCFGCVALLIASFRNYSQMLLEFGVCVVQSPKPPQARAGSRAELQVTGGGTRRGSNALVKDPGLISHRRRSGC